MTKTDRMFRALPSRQAGRYEMSEVLEGEVVHHEGQAVVFHVSASRLDLLMEDPPSPRQILSVEVPQAEPEGEKVYVLEVCSTRAVPVDASALHLVTGRVLWSL